MHRRLTVAVVMVLILVLAASAAMADPPRTWKMRGSQGLIVGRYTDNFDYQGTRTVPIGGGFTLKVNSAADTGVVTAYGYGTFTPEYDVHLTGWLTIVMDTWIEMAPFMDGGIAEDVILHGDTGQGPSVMPTIWSGLAGWGEADVYVNGSLVYEDLDGHFMYTEKARRDRDPVGGYPIAIGAFGAYTHYAPSGVNGYLGFTDPTQREFHLVAHSLGLDPEGLRFPPHRVWFHLNHQGVGVLKAPADALQ
jgi:hypothetical protein